MRRLLLLTIALLGPGCEKEIGDDCTAGEDDCPDTLICYHDRCRTSAYVAFEKKRWAALEAAAKDEIRHREENLLRQSGVEVVRTAEALPDGASLPPPGASAGPGAVRVARAKGTSPIFAACRPTERLLGGGCKVLSGESVLRESYPEVAPGAPDTTGGRWICAIKIDRADDLMAYALCQDQRPGAGPSVAP